jgi:DNA-binding MarR family transcriptional regulator
MTQYLHDCKYCMRCSITVVPASLNHVRSDATDALLRTSRTLVAVVVRSLAEVAPQITVVQLRVLVMVSGTGVMTVNEIAAGLGVNASSASRTCERLVRAGLLHRAERHDDRRHNDISPTDAGREVVDGVMRRRRSELAAMLEDLTGAELEQLSRGLDALNLVADRREADPDRSRSSSEKAVDGGHPGADHHLLGWMA